MSSVDAQGELALAREPQRIAVPIEMVRAKKAGGAAFTLACDSSGLEDKEICAGMSPPLDAGYFSRMKKGTATLDVDRIPEFCRVVGNTIYPEWIAYQIGCTLVMLKSEAERRAEVAEHERDELRRKLDFATEMLMGRRNAA